METDGAGYPWFALHVRTGHEKKVAARLEGKCYEHFLPVYPFRRCWSDRIKETEIPLFPGYLFCRINMACRLPILTTLGVIRIVSIGGAPEPVDEAEVAAIQTLVRSKLSSQPWPFLEIGQRVRIEHGPLRGLEGILMGFRGLQRLVLSVTLLQRSVAVQIDKAWVSSTLRRYPHEIPFGPPASPPDLRL